MIELVRSQDDDVAFIELVQRSCLFRLEIGLDRQAELAGECVPKRSLGTRVGGVELGDWCFLGQDR
jgi:hypothetical protein